jgi:serine phosphatase RsbU (regulator of sigma subunit)
MKNADKIVLDVDLAGEVQQLLFPKSSPMCSWCCLGVKNRMAVGLGGDYFDFLSAPDGCQVIFLGDVTGHGLTASVVMSLLYGYLHHATMQKCTPLETVSMLNTFLRSFAERSDRYDYLFSSSLFFSVIEPGTLDMHYVNAGHVAPMVRRGDQIFSLASTGVPLGFFDEPEMAMRTFRFKQGDRLLLMTDGITETTSATGDYFGIRRLEQILRLFRGDHLAFLDEVFRVVGEFGCGERPTDDCTAIVCDFHNPAVSD